MIKKALTQSEKQRYFVDEPRTIYSDNPLHSCINIKLHADKFFDCQQNLIEERKYKQKVQTLERTRQKCLAKLNEQKYAIKLKYRELLNIRNDTYSSQTFHLEPGFRYKRNGELKTLSNITNLRKSSESELSLSDLHSTSSNHTAVAKSLSQSSSGSGDGFHQNLRDTRAVISQIEHDIKTASSLSVDSDGEDEDMETDKDKDMGLLMHDVKSSLARTRAYLRESRSSKPKIEPDDFEQCYRMKSQAIFDRLARHGARSSCMACQFRLKRNKTTEPTVVVNKSTKKPWRVAPSGVYVAKPVDDHSILSKRSLTHRASSGSERKLQRQKTKSGSNARVRPASTELVKSSINDVCDLQHSFQTTSVNPLLERFKQRENLITQQSLSSTGKLTCPHIESNQKMSSQSQPQLLQTLINSNEGSEQILQVENIQDLQKQPAASQQQLPNQEQLVDTQSKIEAFLSKLPKLPPTVTTWRNSSGQLVTWKSLNQPDTPEMSILCDSVLQLCCSEKTSTSDVSVSIKNSKYKDPNSVEELLKCRYLRPSLFQHCELSECVF